MGNGLELLTPETAGKYLGGERPVATETLRWWRHLGRGPNYVKIGRRVLYRRDDLDAFIAKGSVQIKGGAHAS